MTNILTIPKENKIKAQICRIMFAASSTATCPYCARKGVVRRNEKFQCQRCKKAWSLTSLTWLKGMKLNWRTFWGLIWCYVNKVPINQTGKLLTISRPTIYRWYDLFRKNLPDHENVNLEETVVIDEAYFGRKNKKRALLAAKQKGTSKVACRVITAGTINRADLTPFLRQHISPGSQLFSDGALIYRGLNRHWPVEHAYDVHSKGEFGKTSEIEGFFGSLRTYIRRMYHHVTMEKLPEIVSEYQSRLMHPEIFEDPASFLRKTLTTFSFA